MKQKKLPVNLDASILSLCSLMLLFCCDRLSVPARRDIESPALSECHRKHLTPLNSPKTDLCFLCVTESFLQENRQSYQGCVSTDMLTALIAHAYMGVCGIFVHVDVFRIGCILPWCPWSLFFSSFSLPFFYHTFSPPIIRILHWRTVSEP